VTKYPFQHKTQAWISNIAEHIRSYGYQLDQSDFESWKTLLFDDLKKFSSSCLDKSIIPTNELFPVCSFFSGAGFPTHAEEISCANLLMGIQDVLNTSIAIIDEKLIHLYLRFYVETGILSPPPNNITNTSVILNNNI